MSNTMNIIKDRILTYEQKVLALAREAENSQEVITIDADTKKDMNEGIICTLYEGNAPYRPRYIVPDYQKFMENGSEFLNLNPPKDIFEAVNNLLILYKHVPSITSFPVYLGNIDSLLEPYIEDEEIAYHAIKLFLTHIDRTITDSFCHANIGPIDTKAGRIILKVQQELETSVPNITMKYNDDTPDDYAIEAINTSFVTAKPSFANDQMFKSEFDENYAIVSCYNGLPIGGGSHTLVRLNLAKLAKKAKDENDFFVNIVPDVVERMTAYMDKRIEFLCEESGFFESSFLIREGLIEKNRFTAMFGIFGLAECVNHFIGSDKLEDKFGHSEKANDLGINVISKIEEEVNKHDNKHATFSNGKFLLHAQSGIDTDHNISPGCRIPIGDEPELHEHIIQAAKFHKFFPTGTADILSVESTAKNNPEAMLDIIKGAFQIGMRYFTFYSSDSDVIRITGYLVKRSEMEKLDAGNQVIKDTVALGLGSVKNQRILERKVRKL